MDEIQAIVADAVIAGGMDHPAGGRGERPQSKIGSTERFRHTATAMRTAFAFVPAGAEVRGFGGGGVRGGRRFLGRDGYGAGLGLLTGAASATGLPRGSG